MVKSNNLPTAQENNIEPKVVIRSIYVTVNSLTKLDNSRLFVKHQQKRIESKNEAKKRNENRK